MQVAAARSKQRRASYSQTSFSGATSVAPRPSDAILEALRSCAGGPASVDGAIATTAMIVATGGPPLQVQGTRRTSVRTVGLASLL